MSYIVGCITGVTSQEKSIIYSRIRRMIGAPVLNVELLDEQIEECLCQSIEEYSSFINNWSLENRMSEMLGLPSDTDFTLKFVSNSLYFEKSFAQSFAEQAGVSSNGTRELKKDFIVLTSGVQDYLIPEGREVNEVLWFTPSFINLFGLDPFANNNISFSEFGASFAGHTLYHVMPVFDTILTAQAAELRNRVRGAEYSYRLRTGPNGTKRLSLYPIPRVTSMNTTPGAGIGGGMGTPGTVFYYYYDRIGQFGNSDYSGVTGNVSLSGQSSGITQGNGLVSGPSDALLYNLDWSTLNDISKTWIKKYAQALAKEVLGFTRGKFDGELPIPNATARLNSESLISNGRSDQEILRNELKERLEKINYKKIIEERASMQESINKTLGYGPLGIYVF